MRLKLCVFTLVKMQKNVPIWVSVSKRSIFNTFMTIHTSIKSNEK